MDSSNYLYICYVRINKESVYIASTKTPVDYINLKDSFSRLTKVIYYFIIIDENKKVYYMIIIFIVTYWPS